MATYSFTTAESTSQTIDTTVTISDMQSGGATGATANTGSASIVSQSGTSVTVRCTGGTSTRTSTGSSPETKTQNCTIYQKYQWSSIDSVWYEYQAPYNNAPATIKASDGTSDLTLQSVTVTTAPRPPSANGTSDGQILNGNNGAGYGTYTGNTTSTVYYYQYNVTVTYTKKPTTGGQIEYISNTTSSIQVRISGLQYGSGYTTLNVVGPTGTQQASIVGSNSAYYTGNLSFTGLAAGTSYSFTANFAYPNELAGSSTASYSTAQLPTVGAIAKVSATTSSITVNITGLAYNSGYTTLSITGPGGTQNVSIAGGSAGNYYSTNATFSGLTANTSYSFTANFQQSNQTAGSSTASYTTAQATSTGTISSVGTATTTSITVRITNLKYGSGYSTLEIVGPDPTTGGTKTQVVSIGGGSAGAYYSTNTTFSGLSPGTSYSFTARFQQSGELLGTSTASYSTAKATTQGTISLVSKTDTSITVNITNLQYGSGYSVLNIAGPSGTQNVSIGGGSGGNYYSTNAVFSGLTASTSYSFTANFTATNENAGSSSNSYTTNAPPKVTYGTLEMSSVTESVQNIRIKNLEYGSGYTQLIITGSDNVSHAVTIAGTNGVSYYTSSVPYSGLTPLTNYTYTGRFSYPGETAGSDTKTFQTTAHVDVAPTLNFSQMVKDGSGITCTFSGYDQDGLRATNTYCLQISAPDNLNYGPQVFYTNTTQNTNFNYTFTKDGLGNPFVGGKVYTVRIILYDKLNQENQDVKQLTYTNTAPSLNFSAIDGFNAVTCTFSGFDQEALRATNTYGLQISGPNDTSYGAQVFYTDATPNKSFTYSFLKDSVGNSLTVGKTYTVRIILYDSEGATSTAVKSVVYSKSRPANFAWTNSKSASGPYNLTAAEWNSFLDRVNDFREYKGKPAYSFNRTVTGSGSTGYVILTYNAFNSAVSGINELAPPTSPPNTVNTGNRVTAYHFTRLRDSLNSIS